MSEETHKLQRGDRIRFIARQPEPGQAPRGQDVRAVIIRGDGTEIPIPAIRHASWYVDGRRGVCTAVLVADGVEVDVEGDVADAFIHANRYTESLARQVSELSQQLEKTAELNGRLVQENRENLQRIAELTYGKDGSEDPGRAE